MEPNPILHPAFDNTLNGFTSDHTWQTIAATCVTKENNEVMTIRGATWIMLDKCKSTQDNDGHFPNNCLDITENDLQYLNRKRLQLNELEQIINSANPHELDFILLQEVDWIHDVQLLDEYQKKLIALGWGIIRTTPLLGEISQLPLVTLYNTKTLKPINMKGCLETVENNDKKKYRGFESEFIHQQTRNPVVITNIHLIYGYTYYYKKELNTYQQQKIQENKFMVMGGNTNNLWKKKSENMVGNRNLATSFHSVKDRPGCFTTQHDDDSKQHDDGFFVSPTQDTYAHIVETTGKYFDLSDDEKCLIANLRNPSNDSNLKADAYHTSEIGKPWKTINYYLEDLEKQLTYTWADLERNQNIILQMEELCQRRANQTLRAYIDNYGKNNPDAFKVTLLFLDKPVAVALSGAESSSPHNNTDAPSSEEPIAHPALPDKPTVLTAQKFITHKGFISNKEDFIALCKQNGIDDPSPSNVFFIFSSNTFRHNKHHHDATLYSIKDGSGIALVKAGFLGAAGFATIGLPTTGVEQIADASQIPVIAKNAVLNIWRAVGFGLSPVIPARSFDYHIVNQTPKGNKKGNGHKYYSNPIYETSDEPSFWGLNEKTPNIVLGDYYVEQLNLIKQFLSIKPDKNEQYLFFSHNNIPVDIQDAYYEGNRMRSAQSIPSDSWFFTSRPDIKIAPLIDAQTTHNNQAHKEKSDLKTRLLANIKNINTVAQLDEHYMEIILEKHKSLLRREDGFHKIFGAQGNTKSWQEVVLALKEKALEMAKKMPQPISSDDDMKFRNILNLSATRWLSLTSDSYLEQYEILKTKASIQAINSI